MRTDKRLFKRRISVCVCVCVCVYIYIHICIYTHTHTHTHTYTYIRPRWQVVALIRDMTCTRSCSLQFYVLLMMGAIDGTTELMYLSHLPL